MDADELLQAESSPTYRDMLREFDRVRIHFLRSWPRHLPVHHGGFVPLEGIRRDGVITLYRYVNGQPVAGDGGFGGVPASEEATAALPETKIGDGETRECAVCLEDYQAGDTLRTLPCSHGFHDRCILPWLRVSRLCPLCRFALPSAAEAESLVDEEEDDDEYSDDDALQ